MRAAALEACLLVAGVTLLASPAWAQVSIDLDVPATTVEVGQAFSVQMQALDSEGTPESPTLKAPPDFAVEGPSVGTNHQMSFVNGQITRRSGISATWRLAARRTGVFTIGPASVQTAKGRADSRAVNIKVVPQGSLPKRPQRGRGFPFDDDDFFGGLPGFGMRRRSLIDEMLGGQQEESEPQAPPEFALDQAPDSKGFVRAKAAPDSVVVGQQVLVDVFAYGSQGRFRENNPHEPRRSDFYSYTLVENSQQQPIYAVEIAGVRYYAVRVRRYALFPLKTGDLEVGPMQMSFYGSAYVTRTAPDGMVRQSPVLQIHVTEPPADGRPIGYQVGDVGDFSLRAEVSPRKLTQGESLSVTAFLEGSGNLPGHLLTPEQKGVTWLEPTIRGDAKEIREGVVGGSRSFTYVVKLDTSGDVDLGDLTLPYYDPASKSYKVARAGLGKVNVAARAASAAAAATGASAEQKRSLASLLSPAEELGPAPVASKPLPEHRFFWLALLGAPMSVIAAQTLRRAVRQVIARTQSKKDSLHRQYKDALAEAKTKTNAADVKAACGALERALYLGIEAHTKIRGRALVQSDLILKLAQHGLSNEQCSALASLLAELDRLRFAPDAANPSELLERTKVALQALEKRRGNA